MSPFFHGKFSPFDKIGNQKLKKEMILEVRSYLLHSFLQVHSAAVPFNVRNYAKPKPANVIARWITYQARWRCSSTVNQWSGNIVML
jgi:hypothetical protein